MGEARPAFAAVAVLGLVAVGCAALPERRSTQPAAPAPQDAVERRIGELRRTTRERPNLYPAWSELAAKCLEKARATLDPRWVRCARDAARNSLAVQVSYEGYAALAAVEAFAHRFDPCLRAARQADEAFPEGGEMLALRVECLFAKGSRDEARELLAARQKTADASAATARFYRDASLAAVAREDANVDTAVAAYLRAARTAAGQKAPGLQTWALVQAAGLLLDHGRADDAEPLLREARAAGPASIDLEAHEAELAAARGRDDEALALFESLIARSTALELRLQAWRLATRLSRRETARRHFDVAEAALRAAVDAGEFYTLDMLARLYLDAGLHCDRALDLARRNLEARSDREAWALLADARARCR